MRRLKRRITKRNLILMLALLVFCVSFSLVYLATGYSMMEDESLIDDTTSLNINPIYNAEEKTLNPEWIEYNAASPEKKAEYDLIPDMYLEDQETLELVNIYDKTDKEYEASVTDSSFTLKTGNKTLPNRNQSGSGLCWAFASLSTVESAMLKKGYHTYSNPTRLSVRQMDYATVHESYINEEYNPYKESNRTEIYTTGGYTSAPYGLLESGVSPVTEDVFGAWNSSTAKKDLDDVINVDNVEYFASDIAMYGMVYANTSRTGTDAWVKKIKNHLINYGEVAIGTIGPSTFYGGSCVYTDASGNVLINEIGTCNSSAGDGNNGHAMVIIGWDDNYSYQYCKRSNSTDSNLTGCSNIVSGKGAFILKNSWGTSVANPYIAYTSLINFAYGTIDVQEKEWDVNYDKLKQRTIEKISANTFEVTYEKGSQKQILETITWKTNYENDIYTIYAKSGNGAYERIDYNVTRGIAGTFSIPVGGFELNSNTFSIKIVTKGGTITDIKAFTSYATETNLVKIDTVVPSSIVSYNTSFKIFTETRNVPTGDKISYEVIADNGINLATIMSFGNLYNVNGMVDSTVSISKALSTTGFTIKTMYNGKQYDSDYVAVASASGLWSEGTGTSADPFIIEDAEDFKNIFADELYMSAYFKLANDIDFTGVDYDPTDVAGAFSGTIDGDNHLIINLNVTSEIATLINEVDGGTIKNLGINNCTFENTSGRYAGSIAATAIGASFENIIVGPATSIGGSYEYSGGVVGYAIESVFTNVANYAPVVNDTSSTSSFSGGIVGYSEGSYFTQIYNEGDIVSHNAITGGIAGGLVLQTNTTDYNEFSYVYNQGVVLSKSVHGGFFGYDLASSLEYAYSIANEDDEVTNFGTISGQAISATYEKVYYLNTGHDVIYSDNSSSVTGAYSKTLSELKASGTYAYFDFTNKWFMKGNYPAFKTFYINFIESIMATDITVNKGYSTEIEYSISPSDVYFDNLQFTSSNNSVATVDNNGLVTGVGKGSTTVKIKALDGSDLTKSITVTVTDVELDFGKLNVDHSRNYILGISPGTKVSKLLTEIKTSGSVKVFDKNAKEMSGTANVTTASRVMITISGTTYFYTVVVDGDVNGTGTVKMSSVMKIADYLFDKSVMTDGAYLEAADVTNDGKITMSDVMKVANSLFN